MAPLGVVQKLNAQMNQEFYASNLCLYYSDWCAQQSLNGSATVLRQQAQHNVTQMMRLFDYLKQTGANPVVGALKSVKPDCSSLEAIFSVFGVAWMSDTFFQAHLDELKLALEGVVKSHPWTYAIVLFLVSKLVNSQAAALTAVAPMGLMLGVEPKMLVAFFPASYGYFVLPTYPSDLACIGFDRSGTTRIGKFILNHSFILPGLIGVSCACAASYLLVQLFF
ncbi:anaerobic C4-dicarboxylate transporter family protein [Cronobacter malonaticus]|uniref:anaerobic C4-dicarboxylate transporter family protein n=2 Tax=Cronobacter malonaticus TaxID=413503 RepID=UPI000CFB514C|nr:anaerobic C4-dicarboxylate transporter family protein [Cronobacter malonaticus]MDI7686816.1 anaerobic C4-dicarboxylate transporter family protein [Cronobacter malonaticus]